MKKALAVLGAALLLAPTIALADSNSFSNLRSGSHGQAVTELQQLLAEDKTVYPEGLITGTFGPKTRAALIRWQLKHGLEGVGYVGPRTAGLLNALMHVSGTTTLPQVPPPASTTPPVAPNPPAPATMPTTTPPVSNDHTPPSFSYITASSPRSDMEIVIWNTNEPATGKVYFGTSTTIDITTAASFASTTLSYQHQVTLTGLSYHTGYYYIIESADAAGNIARTAQNFFQTSN